MTTSPERQDDPSIKVPQTCIDQQRRQFLLASAGVLGGLGALCALTPLVSSWMPSAKAQAEGGPVEVDISRLEPGQQAIVPWRGKPVWIIHRTPEMLTHLQDHLDQLRDPDSLVEQQPLYAKNPYRSIKPGYIVLIGICTHLGCSPKYQPNTNPGTPSAIGGFFCPCHGSTFDMAGRVYKGVPAPINLEVPPHHFVNDQTLIIGEEAS